MAAHAGQLRHVLLPLNLASVLVAPELQPLRCAAAAPGHLALAMRGGRTLYVFDGPLPTAGAHRSRATARTRLHVLTRLRRIRARV
jgi:hypothetical protein